MTKVNVKQHTTNRILFFIQENLKALRETLSDTSDELEEITDPELLASLKRTEKIEERCAAERTKRKNNWGASVVRTKGTEYSPRTYKEIQEEKVKKIEKEEKERD